MFCKTLAPCDKLTLKMCKYCCNEIKSRISRESFKLLREELVPRRTANKYSFLVIIFLEMAIFDPQLLKTKMIPPDVQNVRGVAYRDMLQCNALPRVSDVSLSMFVACNDVHVSTDYAPYTMLHVYSFLSYPSM